MASCTYVQERQDNEGEKRGKNAKEDWFSWFERDSDPLDGFHISYRLAIII